MIYDRGTIRRIGDYVGKCDVVLEGADVGEAKDLSKEIISIFKSIIPNVKDELDQYRVVYASREIDYMGDIRLLKAKILFLVDTKGEFALSQSVDKSINVTNGIHSSGNSTNTNTNTNTNTIDFKAELSKIREKIEADETLDDGAKEEINAKLNEIEIVMDEDTTNNEKWKKLKGVVNWVTTKGYKVGEMVMPLLIKSMFPEVQ
ncbi:hypothetical protein [Clostridium tagluense]|uniref:hypothetical protein n=1 Tax=Clostridium tagluense TaxID=360422 RepID=UPI001CF5B144|nr:hypothetical protein [Clostridium tagluense]MCB2300573.1 hypothetical protein [Clostridium tagluense]